MAEDPEEPPLFDAPPLAEQERMVEAILFASAEPLTLAALALLFVLTGQMRDPRALAFALWAFGFGYFAVALRWIVEPFFVDVARHGWMAPFALVLMASGAALFWAFAG